MSSTTALNASRRARELAALTDLLAGHFVTYYGAPSVEAARPVAAEELSQMAELCEEHAPNTLLTVARDLTASGVREAYRVITPSDAGIDMLAVHGSLDDPH